MTPLLVVIGVVLAASALFAVAWVLSGPRFQGRSRGRRPDYSSDAEQDALLHASYNATNRGGVSGFPL